MLGREMGKNLTTYPLFFKEFFDLQSMEMKKKREEKSFT